MQVSDKIDALIDNLQKLKPYLPIENDEFTRNFELELKESIEKASSVVQEYSAIKHEVIESQSAVPSWVDTNYTYDPNNPRKPNIRELSEALAGCSLEELHSRSPEKYYEITSTASDLLNTVVGSNEDTRNWHTIMGSSDIVSCARLETAKMHSPVVDIVSNFDENGNLTEQFAALKNKDGVMLKPLSGSDSLVAETLLNFGATKESIPTDLEERIHSEKFDADLLAFLKNFGNHPSSVQEIVVQSTSEAISNKISQEIPLDGWLNFSC